MSTNVAVFDTVLENVLSNTSPYMPPSPSGTSYVPIETFSASHFPAHWTCFRPMADSFSSTNVFSLREVEMPRPRVGGTSSAGVEGPVSKVAEEGRFGVAPLVWPGCLKMPKLIDFLWGCMLQEIVCPAETLTQRTRYDCHAPISCIYRVAYKAVPCYGLPAAPCPPLPWALQLCYGESACCPRRPAGRGRCLGYGAADVRANKPTATSTCSARAHWGLQSNERVLAPSPAI